MGTYSDPTTFSCVTRCPIGYFADGKVCSLICSSGYGFVLNRTCVNVCDALAAPYIYRDTTKKMCVVQCIDPDYGYQ